MNGTINGYKNDDISLVWKEMQRVHTAINKTKDVDQMPRVYYATIAKMLNGKSVSFLVKVVDMLVMQYRGFNMPKDSEVKSCIKEIKANEAATVSNPYYRDEYVPNETEKEKISIRFEVIKRNLKRDGCSNVSSGKQKVLARKARIRANIAAGLEYCEFTKEWMPKGTALRVRDWEAEWNNNESEKVDFKDGLA